MLHKITAIISFSFLLLFGNTLYSQTLNRKVFLGARLMELSVVEEELGTDSGIYLPNILPDASFGKMGIPAGVVLQHINEKKIQTLSDLSDALDGIKAGDALKVIVFKNRESKPI